jgi:hypothetical protein
MLGGGWDHQAPLKVKGLLGLVTAFGALSFHDQSLPGFNARKI